MGMIFRNELHDQFGTWPLAYIRAGGVEFGEILAVAREVGDGDDAAFHAGWTALGERLWAAGREAADLGLRASARAFFLKSACAYAASYHPLYGEPVDARLLEAFRRQTDAFALAMSLSRVPPTPLRIPFEGPDMPGWLIPAVGHEDEVRPLLICTNGYDATLADLYFGVADEATRRGYHCLIFDGPGQGEMLYEHGVRLRPDWETVVSRVVDVAHTLPTVDAERIAITGWSLGGYLAPRAASGEPRIRACIADPGQWSIAEAFRRMAGRLGVPAARLGRLDALDDAVLQRIEAVILADPRLRWSVVQRGFWVHGTPSLREYLASVDAYTLEGRIEAIRCPTLLTAAENDPLSATTANFFEALQCPKAMLRFTAAEGAGEHCEMLNRSLANHRALDWLDQVFSV